MVPIEPFSATIGVATLFGTCIDCFGYFKAAQALEDDFELLELELDLLKLHLLTWGKSSGLLDIVSPPPPASPVDEELTLGERCLQKIHSLLTNSAELKLKYGVEESHLTLPASSTKSARRLPSFQIMGVFRTSKLFVRLRSSKSSAPGPMARLYWAVHDKEKFESLLGHLKSLIEGLEKISPTPRAFRDQTFHSGIAELDLSQLSLVDDACEMIGFPELASIAKTVIDASEVATSDLRRVEEWTADFAQSSQLHGEVPSASCKVLCPSAIYRPNHDQGNIMTKQNIFFILTQPCRNSEAGEFCEVAASLQDRLKKYSHQAAQVPSLGQRIVSHIDLHQVSSMELDKIEEYRNKARERYESPDLLKSAIYIHCPPCACSIQMALEICLEVQGIARDMLDFKVRFDARLTASCCLAEGRERLNAIFNYIRSGETAASPFIAPHLLKNVDRDWLDQRVYEYEDEVEPQTTNDLRHILEGYRSLHSVAGIIILGERDHLLPALNRPPFAALERTPRETQFFKLDHSAKLSYLGSYSPRPPVLVRRGDAGSQQEVTSSFLTPNGATTSPGVALGMSSQSSAGSSKRRKTTSSTKMPSNTGASA